MVARKLGISSYILYALKKQLLDEKSGASMGQTPTGSPSDGNNLAAKLGSLRRQVYALKMKVHILNK
jgi:hypothetical protein